MANWNRRHLEPEITLEPAAERSRSGDDIPRGFSMQGYYGQAHDMQSGQGYSDFPPPLPHNAAPALFVQGFPSDITERKLAHIFRPFCGFIVLRLKNKDSQLHRNVKTALCFVDFISPTYAATAMYQLQGYKIDQLEPDSPHLKLDFARPRVVRQNR